MEDFDIENQLASQRFKRALAEQNQPISSPQGKMVGNIYVRSNPLEALISGLRMKQSKDELGASRQELKDLSAKRQTALTNALRKSNEYMAGTPAVASKTTATEMPTFDDADAATMQGIQGYGATTGGQAAVAPDPFKASTALIESGIPSLQTAGFNQLMELNKTNAAEARAQANRARNIELWNKAGGDAVKFAALGGDLDMAKTMAELPGIGKVKGIVAGDSLVNPYTGDKISSIQRVPNKASDLLIPDENGNLVPNSALINVQSQIKASGRPPAAPRNVQTINTADGPMILNPDGTVRPITGPTGEQIKGVKPETTSEGERKAGTLLTRLRGSQAQLAEVLSKNPNAASPNVVGQALSSVGMESAGNLVTSSDRQRVNAAQLDLLDAALTLGTGAAYTREQLEGYRKSFFPQIGDSPATIKDKQDRLNNVIKSAEVAAGRAEPQSTPKFGPGATRSGPTIQNAQQLTNRIRFDAQGNIIQ
jgi:hypothetical protein